MKEVPLVQNQKHIVNILSDDAHMEVDVWWRAFVQPT